MRETSDFFTHFPPVTLFHWCFLKILSLFLLLVDPVLLLFSKGLGATFLTCFDMIVFSPSFYVYLDCFLLMLSKCLLPCCVTYL